MKRKKNLYSILIAGLIAGSVILAGCGSSSGDTADVTEDGDGSYTAECTTECDVVEQELSYTVRLKVTADADGTIQKVEDNGTKIPDGKDGAYKKAEALFGELAGKNADTLSEVDAVSGATSSSNAIIDAVKEGLDAINRETEK